MKPPAEEIDRRKPVWAMLSELFLDIEHSGSWLRVIAERIEASGYTIDELDLILRLEVGPAVGDNLRCIGGEWNGFDPDWLAERILKRERSWFRWLPCFNGYGDIRSEWELIRGFVAQIRMGQAEKSSATPPGTTP